MLETTPSKQKLGTWTTTSLVVGNMIGAGVFLMPAALAAYGSIGLLGWLFAAVGAFLLARVFGNLSQLMPQSDGGPYAFAHRGFGDFVGFLVAWGYWISIWCANAAIVVSLISALSTFFPILQNSPILAIMVGLATVWGLTWVNTLGIVTSGRVQFVTTVLKILPLLVVAVVGLFYFKIENLLPFNASGLSDWSAIGATASCAFYAFLGIECATVPSNSVENPEKTIPRATMLGTIVATIVYFVSTLSVMGMIPAKNLKNSLTPFADAAVLIWGPNAAYWVSAGVAIAAFGALNGWIMIQGQIPYAIAKDALFPKIFAKTNRKGVPTWGIVIGSVLLSFLVGMNYTKGLVEQFKFLILLTTLSTLVPYIFSTAAYILILLEEKRLISKTLKIKALTLATSAFLFSLWAIIGSGQEAVYWGFILMMAGIPFYVGIIWNKNTEGSSRMF